MEDRLVQQAKDKLRRLDEIERLMEDSAVTADMDKMRTLGKELRELQKVRAVFTSFSEADKAFAEARQLIDDPSADKELKGMAEHELAEMTPRRAAKLAELEDLLIKKDPMADKDVVIEVRAGTGGVEASLFAAEVVRMYSRYSANRGYKVEILSQADTDAGGAREVILSISGDGVYGRFKYESGVHRVQRVPQTEAAGRIHTSAITVAVMPEAEEVEVNIRQEDLKIDVFRSGGPGGQSVNTTDSAVRILHVPSGLMVKCQDEKSQLKNKAKALKILRARLFEKIQSEQQSAMDQKRKAQIGSGDRSEKIRTYNFPERRVTDHRIGLTIHNLEAIMDGDLDEVIDALVAKEKELATAS